MRIKAGKAGDYITVGEALCAVPYNEPSEILIEEGVYNEKLSFEKKELLIRGVSEEKTLISFGDGAKEILQDGYKRGTFRSYTVFASGQRISMKDLSIENCAGTGKEAGQAVALYADADIMKLERVTLRSHQDTLFLSPLPRKEREERGFYGPRTLSERKLTRQYYKDCTIEGDIDFIFGGADALFENCLIKVNGSSGYIAAPCEGGEMGLLFKDCRIYCEKGGEIFLGRPWRPEGKAVYLNCSFSEGIDSRRFSGWKSVTEGEPEAFFAEYGSRLLPGAELDESSSLTGAQADEPLLSDGAYVDLSRKNEWVKVLSDAEAGELIEKLERWKAEWFRELE